MKKIPIGISDFKELIESNYFFIDKTNLIKDLIEDGSKVILLPRPRRFGKTLNISMIKYFFEDTKENHGELFRKLNIYKFEDILQYQGKFPVIHLTFKDIKDSNYDKFYEKIKELISKEYNRHRYLLESNKLNEVEKLYYNDIVSKNSSPAEYETSLQNLSEFLFKHHGIKVIILIDEYDVPIQEGYMKNYYNNIVEFMRNFLSGGLKDNKYLEKAVMTGILRVAKESIFSGLNNLEVCSILSNSYSQYFGFTEEEVQELCKYFNMESQLDKIRTWYNGYKFGNSVIYNPWSLLNFTKSPDSGFKSYWVNTAENGLIKMLLAKGNEEVKKDLESLVKGEKLAKQINENVVISEVDKNTSNLWSFFLLSGYLKAETQEVREGITYCDLKIPNKEVKTLYKDIILSWFKDNVSEDKYKLMINSLLIEDIETFEDLLSEFLLKSVSYFDINKENENFYHAFVLGILVSLSDTYDIRSNRESGFGRYDIMMIPKNKEDKGFVIEFKKVNKRRKETLAQAVTSALDQIVEKNYKQELIDLGIHNITEIGIAFEGKEVLVRKNK